MFTVELRSRWRPAAAVVVIVVVMVSLLTSEILR